MSVIWYLLYDFRIFDVGIAQQAFLLLTLNGQRINERYIKTFIMLGGDFLKILFRKAEFLGGECRCEQEGNTEIAVGFCYF